MPRAASNNLTAVSRCRVHEREKKNLRVIIHYVDRDYFSVRKMIDRRDNYYDTSRY